MTVTPEGSKTNVSVVTPNPQGGGTIFSSGPYGSAPLYPRVDVVGNSGNGFPSGTVTLLDNGQPINGGLTLTLNSQGNALPTNPIYTFAAGSHSLSASYSGDASFDASSNPSSSTTPATFTITQTATTAALPQADGGSTPGSTEYVEAYVTAQSCGNPPSGTITFFLGSTQTGTPQAVQSSVGSNCAVQAFAAVNTTPLALGNNSISYKYSGDTDYAPSASPTLVVDEQIPTTTTISSSAATIQQGQSVTFTAAVTPNQAGGPGPTGTVKFSASVSGVSLPNATLTNGMAQITTTALPAGTYFVYANYSGDTDYAFSSNGITQQVTPGPDFSITFSPSTVNVSSPGASASTMVSVTGSNGFTTPISFAAVTCAGLPSESSCSFNPIMVSPGSSTTLTILTTAPSALVPSGRPSIPPAMGQVSQAVSASGTWERALLLIFACALFVFPFRRRQLRWIGPVLLFSLLIINAACGGGGGGGTGPTNPGTPMVQNQPITITVTSGTTTHSFSFTLNVN